MLLANGATVAASHVPDAALPMVTNLPGQLGGRMLLKFVRADQLATYTLAPVGTRWTRCAYLTPTPYCADDLPAALNLPAGMLPPTHALVLDPAGLVAVGPRRVRWGTGIEYVLPYGFAESDIAWPKWPVALR